MGRWGITRPVGLNWIRRESVLQEVPVVDHLVGFHNGGHTGTRNVKRR